MRRVLFAALLLAAPAAAREVRLPVLEAGVAGGGWLPDDPAADQNHLRGIAVPFVIYRGGLSPPRVPVTPAFSLMGGGRVEELAGAANADGPLHRGDWNATAAPGFAWSPYQSAATVASSAGPFD